MRYVHPLESLIVPLLERLCAEVEALATVQEWREWRTRKVDEWFEDGLLGKSTEYEFDRVGRALAEEICDHWLALRYPNKL